MKRCSLPSADHPVPSASPGGDSTDVGLLSPGWAGLPVADATGDLAVLSGLVLFETGLASVIAPGGVARRVLAASDGIRPSDIAFRARVSGNPVIPLLDELRARLRAVGDDEAAEWLHRGATSQDALDTALVLVARSASELIVADAVAAARHLAEHAQTHRTTVMTGRTLTQASTPTTLGLKLAGWAWSIARASTALHRASAALPVQLGGASGTLASFRALADTGAGDPPLAVADALAAELDLASPVAPWHVHRSPITRLADALAETSDAIGTLSANVALLARTEIGELDDGASGGSSAMPHKSNPTRAVLINAAARQAPLLAAQLHLDAAGAVDERPDGAWHAEWQTLRSLLRTVGGSAASGRELAAGLRVNEQRIAANLSASAVDLLSESVAYSSEALTDPADYIGEATILTDRLLDAVREELA